MSSVKHITPKLSIQKVLELCSKNGNVFNGEIITIDKLKDEPIVTLISTNKGFCSDVYRIEFFTEKSKYSVIAKVPIIKHFEYLVSDLPESEHEKQRQENFKLISELHSNEILFYEFYSKFGYNINLNIPKYYFGNNTSETEEGLILMEDLSDKCCNEKFKGLQFLTDNQIKECIVEIAKLQAWGFTISEAQKVLGKINRSKIAVHLFNLKLLKALEEMKYPWMTEEKLQMLYKTNEMDEYEKLCMGNYKLPLVLCHNDFWAGNLLFSDDGSLVTILDWQNALFASPTQDLAALLASGLPSFRRRKNEKEYLQFYFDTFKYYLEKFHVKDDKGYRKLDLKTLEQSYRTSLKVTIFPVISTWENFDKFGDNGGELENCIRYLLEDID